MHIKCSIKPGGSGPWLVGSCFNPALTRTGNHNISQKITLIGYDFLQGILQNIIVLIFFFFIPPPPYLTFSNRSETFQS